MWVECLPCALHELQKETLGLLQSGRPASVRRRWGVGAAPRRLAGYPLLLAADSPMNWNCGHWPFLTFKCWTCCFKHLYILEVEGASSGLADIFPLALLPIASVPCLFTLARKSACHTEEPWVLSPSTSSLTSPSVLRPCPPIYRASRGSPLQYPSPGF